MEEEKADSFDPESGELMLGDIVLSRDKILEQAEAYGHSTKREFAFLVAHSMLHLCGYDHMTEEEAKEMERRQEILQSLSITKITEGIKHEQIQKRLLVTATALAVFGTSAQA